MKNIRVKTLTPDRGDRTEFTLHMITMMQNQTHQPIDMVFVNHPPKSNACDITERYRIGYNSISDKDTDVILLIENDDWYHQKYIETMVREWIKAGKPDIFGINTSYYYHLGLQSFHKTIHTRRSCAMSTLIKPGLNIRWPLDNEPFTDVYLWNQIKNAKLFTPVTPICLGIKHGIGKTGGGMHTSELHRYKHPDQDHKFLNTVLKEDPHSLAFYKIMKNKCVSIPK